MLRAVRRRERAKAQEKGYRKITRETVRRRNPAENNRSHQETEYQRHRYLIWRMEQ
jgi:hypothetical protein